MKFNFKNCIYLIFNIFNVLIYLMLSNESKITGMVFATIIITLHVFTIYMVQDNELYKVFTEYGRYVPLYEVIIYFVLYVLVKQGGGNDGFILFIIMLSKFLFYYTLIRQFESKLLLAADEVQNNLITFSRVLAVMFIGMIIFSSNMKSVTSSMYTTLFIILIGIAVMYGSEYIWYMYLFNSKKKVER